MSQLPPAGEGIRQDARPEDMGIHQGAATAATQDNRQYNNRDVERRSGGDRRILPSVGGRRTGPASRRGYVAAEASDESKAYSGELRSQIERFEGAMKAKADLASSGEVNQPKPEPVHETDAGGHLTANENAPVEGITDAERVADAVEHGKPVASAEAGARGVPETLTVPANLPAADAARQSATVDASKTQSIDEFVEEAKQVEQKFGAPSSQAAMSQSERRVSQRRSVDKPVDRERRRAVVDRRGLGSTSVVD